MILKATVSADNDGYTTLEIWDGTGEGSCIASVEIDSDVLKYDDTKVVKVAKALADAINAAKISPEDL